MTSLAVDAAPAGADAYSGVLGIKGVGSIYAGTDASGVPLAAAVSRPGAPGSTSTFALEVVNNGTRTAQYQVDLVTDGPSSVAVLTVGSTNVTALATQSNPNQDSPSPYGYETTPIAPGKNLLLTLKVTIPKTALPGDQYYHAVGLFSPGGSVLFGGVVADVQSDSPAPPAANLVTVTANSQPAVWGEPEGPPHYYTAPLMTAATITKAAPATFTVRLKNHSAVAAVETIAMAPPDEDCAAASFQPTITNGTTNVTALATGPGGYTLAHPLPPNTVLTLTVTVRSLAQKPDFASGCGNLEGYHLSFTANGDTANATFIDVIVNAV